jgi:hypothetical protein
MVVTISISLRRFRSIRSQNSTELWRIALGLNSLHPDAVLQT